MTLDEIAEKNGWTLTTRGERATTEYTFKKGELLVRFSRAGHGSLFVRWRNQTVPWTKSFHVGDTFFSPSLKTREEYAEELLPLITEEAAVMAIEKDLRHQVEVARTKLARAEEELKKFLNLLA